MKLNGWMRIWLVLSVAWCLVVLLFSFSNFSEVISKQKMKVTKEGLGDTTMVFSKIQTDAEVEFMIEEKYGPQMEKEPGKFLGKLIDTPYKDEIKKRFSSSLIDFLRFALLPLVILLALGWSVAWIRRGFIGVR